MTAITPVGARNPRARIQTLLACLLLAGLALVSLAAVIAPTANAGPDRTLRSSFHIDELNIYDPVLSNACGFEVVALITGDVERKLELGNGKRIAAHETKKFDGTITWIARASGKTYTDKIENRSKIEYPQGIDLFVSAHVTVTGSHGGTFPVAGGPPGNGKFEYDAQIYAIDDEGFPYIFETSEPTWTGRSFDRATEKICARLG
jgi:hypothetical protein